MIVNNADNDEPYEEFECDEESPLQGQQISKPHQYKSKQSYINGLDKALSKADADFKKYHSDKTVTEFESYIKEVRNKFALEHTFKKVNDDEYFNEHDLLLLSKLAVLGGIKTDKLKKHFLNQTNITMTAENFDKAYGHTNYNFDNVLKMIKEDKSLSSFFECKSLSFVFKLISANIKLNGTQTKVNEFIHKLILYRNLAIEQGNFEKLGSEIKQLKEKLIVSNYNKSLFPEEVNCSWKAVALGLSSEGYKPKQILGIIKSQNLLVDKNITSEQLRNFLYRYKNK